ncbi:NUDIX domain-containing protein [Crateriforma conspicua]|uniref:GDP-mannose pyrophosphatase n=1 Tax=Crateriforma conspicua TaxID=2527996 RepID=A0A5C5XT90_9PLAN|nr:NUDIX hydrolase [Crateriforma conspicua]QDV60946.1 ADP-ribose pyrophosphatase [Crateriforma conspicua]TWT65781.1 ADP-ribose pyrophosphatase [Crateriforma conspicua]
MSQSTPRRHGPWTINQSATVYQDPWIRVCRDEVTRPDGKPGTHSVVHLKHGVSVLAIDHNRDVYLTEEFHYGVGRVTLESVSGGIEPGEDAESTARRELKEEIGIVANRWTDLGVCDPFTASVVSPTKLYLAEEIRHEQATPEGTELIRCVRMPLADAVEKVLRSEITHAPSCLLILMADRIR